MIHIAVRNLLFLFPGERRGCRSPFAPEISDTYWVGVCVDEVAGESNTSNNCSMGIQVEVLPAPDGCVFSTSGNVDAVIDNHVFSSDNRCTASNSISAPHATGSLGPVEIPSGVAIKLEAETITLYPMWWAIM